MVSYPVLTSSVFICQQKVVKLTVNANVNSSALSRTEREQISDLVVVACEEESKSRSRSNKSFHLALFLCAPSVC